MTETLYVVTAVANPLLLAARGARARAAVADWLKEPNVHITLVEVAYGSRGYELADLASVRVTHLPLRATTMAWSKENLLNLGIATLPADAQKIATLDADITFRKTGWATETLNALDLYPVIQPWSTAYDLGPQDQHVQTHTSFASLYHAGLPVVAGGPKFWTFNGGAYQYAHTGYAWAWTKTTLARTGGLFELGGMGSGDHHMALGLIGQYAKSLPGGISANYRNAVAAWGNLASAEINGKLGFVTGTVEHPFHGKKVDRDYLGRWDMFLEHGFDPTTDLKYNTQRVIEFAGNKPDLERSFDRYLRARNEDTNSLS